MEESNKLEQEPGAIVQPKVILQTQKPVQEIITEGVTLITDKGQGYLEFEEKLFQRDALKELRPDLFAAKPDLPGITNNSNFGTRFPNVAAKGDIFVRVDILPNRVYKFDGKKWIEINKSNTTSYLNDEYVQFLIDKVDKSEYDLEHLSENEKDIILEHLNTQNN